MPAADPRGDTRRDPRWLLILALVLLVARVGVSVWEDRNKPSMPAFPPSIGHAPP